MRLWLTLTFLRRSSYHIETSALVSSGNQWTGFYMVGTSVMNELKIKVLKVNPNFKRERRNSETYLAVTYFRGNTLNTPLRL